jgi:hypothetical protein
MGDSVSSLPPRRLPALFVLPLLFAAVALAFRHLSGPHWIWHVVDASYFYLFDALNLANLTWPGHPYHPGTPVQVMGALVLRVLHPTLAGPELVAAVLDDPEGHLTALGNALIAVQAVALLVAGLIGLVATRSLFLALVVQTGPFLSMVILKNAYHVKPEPMLVAVMALFTALALLALRPGALEGTGRTRFAVAFGILAGFGVATKLTAAPVFLAPLFLLGTIRSVLVYGIVSAMALALFLLPAAGSLHLFADYVAMIAHSSGPYGTGAARIIDTEAYPKALLKILKRPTAFLPIVIAAAVLATSLLRRCGPLGAEARMLAGILLACLVEALFVAKQPTANYMIPAYMLLPLSIVLAWRFFAGSGIGGPGFRARAGRYAMVGIVLALVPQAWAVAGQGHELLRLRDRALARDDGEFDRCARVYFFPASAPSFALNLGNWWTGSRFGKAVAGRVPANQFWFEQNTRDLRDAEGSRDIAEIAATHPCLVLRGGHKGPMLTYLAEKLPDLKLDSACSTPDEFVFSTAGVCSGDPR